MRKLSDDKLQQYYLNKFQIYALFDTENLPFELYEYDKGEFVNTTTDLSQCILFLVAGMINIHALHADGSKYQLCRIQDFMIIGDMEFSGGEEEHFWVEADTMVRFIALPLHHCRQELYRDNTFLRFLLRSVTNKLSLFSKNEAECLTLEEKLLQAVEQNGTKHEFCGVETMAVNLHCSRRQLQRLLKKLCEQKRMIKTGKGKYRLNEKELGKQTC